MTAAVSEREADAGAKALREHQMAGRLTAPWQRVSKSQRKKWIEAATLVIAAAKQAGQEGSA